MSDVVSFRGPPAKPANYFTELEKKFGHVDATVLKWCAEWRVARARQLAHWAEYDLKVNWPDTLSTAAEIALDLSALEEMRELESLLAEQRPHTVATAVEMLGIAIDILTCRERKKESSMGEGPVLEILRNVEESLGWLPAKTRMESEADAGLFAPKPADQG